MFYGKYLACRLVADTPSITVIIYLRRGTVGRRCLVVLNKLT